MKKELIKKIQAAVVDMMGKVKFDEKAHRYETIGGTWLQGVSTVSSIMPKEWLSAWGAKEAVKALGYSDYEGDTELAKQVMKKIIDLETPEQFIAMLKEAKGASRKKNNKALVDGTKGHAYLEEYVKAKIRGVEVPAIPKGTLERPVTQFIEWAEANVDTWVLSEARVADPEKGFAGTLDGLAIMKTGKLAIIDFKFASHISEDYFLQTAGYQATFEPYDIKIDERIIVRLPKTLEIEEWDKEARKYKMIPNNIEIKVVDTEYEIDKQVFLACLPVKQWINYMQNNYKNNK